MQLPQLRRIRWAVRAALMLGVAASVAANILHAQPNPISQTISAWPPLALLLTVELTSRIPMHKRGLAAVRVLATVAIAGIAAWVSYWHMQGVAVRFGETEASAYLLPVSVDGLIVVASVSLVELAGRIRMLEDQKAEAALVAARAPDPRTAQGQAPLAARAWANGAPARGDLTNSDLAHGDQVQAASTQPVQFGPQAQPATTPLFRSVPAVETAAASGTVTYSAPAPAVVSTVTESGAPLEPVRVGAATPLSVGVPSQSSTGHSPLSESPLSQSVPLSPAVAATTRPVPTYVNGSTPPARPSVTRAAVSAPARTVVTAATTMATESQTPRQRRPVQETAELADEIEAMHPEISQTELARRLGISATRLRAVRREAREVRRTTSTRL